MRQVYKREVTLRNGIISKTAHTIFGKCIEKGCRRRRCVVAPSNMTFSLMVCGCACLIRFHIIYPGRPTNHLYTTTINTSLVPLYMLWGYSRSGGGCDVYKPKCGWRQYFYEIYLCACVAAADATQERI